MKIFCWRPVFERFHISSPYGATDSKLRTEPHKGVDFACPEGTPVFACWDGVILMQKYHTDGSKAGTRLWIYNRGRKMRAGYFHMSEFRFEKPGQEVKEGDLVGWSGNTGNSSGPHLHFQIEALGDDRETFEPAFTFSPLEKPKEGPQ